MDTSTYEILKECNSGCRMALNSIEQLAVYLKSQELQDLFCKYKEDYKKMEKESIRLSEGKLQEEKLSEKAAETFAWISAEVKMMLNDDSSKIAEMMIDGANMGIKSITEKLNRYPEAEKESISLAKKFEKTCEKLIQDMKKICLFIYSFWIHYCYKVLNQGENYERYIRKKIERLYGGTDR